jgi:hypothetical protein
VAARNVSKVMKIAGIYLPGDLFRVYFLGGQILKIPGVYGPVGQLTPKGSIKNVILWSHMVLPPYVATLFLYRGKLQETALIWDHPLFKSSCLACF